jgi:hypothetical protein
MALLNFEKYFISKQFARIWGISYFCPNKLFLRPTTWQDKQVATKKCHFFSMKELFFSLCDAFFNIHFPLQFALLIHVYCSSKSCYIHA